MNFIRSIFGKGENGIPGKLYLLTVRENWKLAIEEAFILLNGEGEQARLEINRKDQQEYAFSWKCCELTHAKKCTGPSAGIGISLYTPEGKQILFEFADDVQSPQIDQILEKLKSAAPVVEDSIALGKNLISAAAKLYTLDTSTGEKELSQDAIQVCIYSHNSDEYRYYLTILVEDGSVALAQEIHQTMLASFTKPNKSLQWYSGDSGGMVIFVAEFLTEEIFQNISLFFAKCLWEINNREKFDKNVNKSDAGFLVDTIMPDVEEINTEEEPLYGDGMDFEDEDEDEEDSSKSSIKSSKIQYSTGGDNSWSSPVSKQNQVFNSELAVGALVDRSFVRRGSDIGVFGYTDDGSDVKFVTSMSTNAGNKNKAIKPTKMMLHDQDTKMLILDESNDNSVFCMDLNRGEVVEEWKTNNESKAFLVTNVLPTEKYAEKLPQQTFIGMNSGALFLVDPRKPGNKEVTRRGFRANPGGNPQLTCAVTTTEGQVAIGSRLGVVRLYDQNTFKKDNPDDIRLTKKAKTTLPGLEPVLGIDVSDSAEWVLITYPTHLIVLYNKCGNTTGFEKSLPKEQRHPIRLQLKDEHVRLMGGKVRFTPAKFSADKAHDRSIVTSTGAYIITWNFDRVKRGHAKDYQIKQLPDAVVADQFRFGTDEEIVVTLPTDVQVARRVKKT